MTEQIPLLKVFTAAPHSDVMGVMMMITILLITARAFGEIMQRLGLPAVIGEISAGIILGPSVLGHFFPAIVGYIIPGTNVQGFLLEIISLLGAMFLLLITGLETDLGLIRRHSRVALGAAAGGMILPLLTGFYLGENLPDYLLANKDERLIFSLFIATAMSISAIPVIAKVLIEMKLIRRDLGQTIIAAGMTDDTTGWILLSIVTALASGEVITGMTMLSAVGKVFLFLLFSFTVGRFIAKKMLDFAQDNLISNFKILTLIVAMGLGWAALALSLHLEPVLGAFVVGIIFGQIPRFPQKAREQLESISFGIFSPIFFAVAGLKVNLTSLFSPGLFKAFLAVIGVAIFGKMVGAYVGARLIGKQDHWRAIAYGAALNARGAMEIIVATIGLSLGILSQSMFSIIVLMAITTSLMAPFLLRWVLTRIQPTAEEKNRLEKEEQAKGSSIQNIHRVLIPLRKPDESHQINFIQIIKSRLLQKIATSSKISITLLNVDDPKFKDENLKFLQQTAELFNNNDVMVKYVPSKDPAEQILEEAKKDYDLVILGASEYRRDRKYLFSNLIDSVVKFCPCSTMIVNTREVSPNWSPNNLLVPTKGSNASKTAAELSFMLASSPHQKLFVLNVIEENPEHFLYSDKDPHFKNQMAVAQKVVDDITSMGELHHIDAIKQIKIANTAEEAIVQVAENNKIDLIILGTEIRPGSSRLFLGPTVEKILQNAPCPVVIINSI